MSKPTQDLPEEQAIEETTRLQKAEGILMEFVDKITIEFTEGKPELSYGISDMRRAAKEILALNRSPSEIRVLERAAMERVFEEFDDRSIPLKDKGTISINEKRERTFKEVQGRFISVSGLEALKSELLGEQGK